MGNPKNVFNVSNKLLAYLIFCGIFLFSVSEAFSASQNNETDQEIRLVRAAGCQNANKKMKQMNKICRGICQDDGNYCKVGDGLIKGPGKKLSCQCKTGSEDPTANEKYSCKASTGKGNNKQKKRVSNFCKKTCKTLEPESTFKPYTCKSKQKKKGKGVYCACFSSSDSENPDDSTDGGDSDLCALGFQQFCSDADTTESPTDSDSTENPDGGDSDLCALGFQEFCPQTDTTENSDGSKDGDNSAPCETGFELSCFLTEATENPDDSESTENSIPPLIPIGSDNAEDSTSTSESTLDPSDIMPTIAPVPMLPPGSPGTENGNTGNGTGNAIQLVQGVGDAIQSASIPIQDEPLDQKTET